MTKSGRNEARKLKRIIVIKRSHVCEVPNCGWSITLQMHHIDCDRQNNIEQNLILLCPNHHSLAHIQDVQKLTIEFFRKILSSKFGYVYD
jgi:hypothetical protein